MTQPKKQPKILQPRGFAILLIIVALVGLFASTVLTLDKIHVLKDPAYNPACNINPVFSCGSVMKTKQAEIAGAPNTLVGLVGFSALFMVGFVMLFGAKMNKRFWQIFEGGVLLGFASMLYLFFQGVYRINALCLYCMSVWVVIILLTWYTILFNLEQKHIVLPTRLQSLGLFVRKHHVDVLIVAYLVFAVLILNHFWYYFKTVL